MSSSDAVRSESGAGRMEAGAPRVLSRWGGKSKSALPSSASRPTPATTNTTSAAGVVAAPAPAPPPAASPGGPAIKVNGLSFCYDGFATPVLINVLLDLPPGTRTLLVGANGAGKTTVLRLLAGKHLVDDDMIRVLGKSAFAMNESTGVSYLGNSWTRTVAFAGYNVPYSADIRAGDMMATLQAEFPARRDALMEVLEINPDWRMHLVSDGQRRRVQIMLGLLRPFKVLLLDEVTVDLDVLGRADLLAFLKAETEQRGATIVYATHIFDGLDGWFTHLWHLSEGVTKSLRRYADVHRQWASQEGAGGGGGGSATLGACSMLLRTVDGWLRQERAERRARAAAAKEAAATAAAASAESGEAMAMQGVVPAHVNQPMGKGVALSRHYNYWGSVK